MVDHSVFVAEAAGLGYIIVVEDLRVHLCGHGVLGGELLLDCEEFQVAVRIADGLLEFVCLVVVEILRGGVGDRDDLVLAGFAMGEDPVEDLAGMVPAREEQDSTISITGMRSGMPLPLRKRYTRATSKLREVWGAPSSIRQILAVVPPIS